MRSCISPRLGASSLLNLVISYTLKCVQLRVSDHLSDFRFRDIDPGEVVALSHILDRIILSFKAVGFPQHILQPIQLSVDEVVTVAAAAVVVVEQPDVIVQPDHEGDLPLVSSVSNELYMCFFWKCGFYPTSSVSGEAVFCFCVFEVCVVNKIVLNIWFIFDWLGHHRMFTWKYLLYLLFL